MDADITLLHVFIDEAMRYLVICEDAGKTDKEREDALASLSQACELVGESRQAHQIRATLEQLATNPAKGRDQLATLVRNLKSHVTAATVDEPTENFLTADGPDEETPDARSSSAIDSGEYSLLRNFFRDEARDALEVITTRIQECGSRGFDTSTFEEVMRKAHSLKGAAGTVGLTPFAEAAHDLEDMFDRVRRQSIPWSRSLADEIIEAIDALREYVGLHDEVTAKPILARARDQLRVLGRRQRRDSEVTVKPVPDAGTDANLQASEDRRGGERRKTELSTLRVDPARIDRLMDSVGELVFDRTRIERRVRTLRGLAENIARVRDGLREARASVAGQQDIAARLGELEANLSEQATLIDNTTMVLIRDTEALARTGTALQDGLTSVRMQTVRTLYQMLAPQLRSISRAAGKRLKLSTTGGETEFDKAVAEQITDSLIQLLRNAVAHGIEPAPERIAAGKPEDGSITLSARHEGNVVVLEVSDDGGGINAVALRERFVASGRWSEEQARHASDDEVLRTIFAAGTSSRPRADSLAGRGFGLDSVRETIARLGGEIRVRSSLGKGTTFTLRLPLTTAISNAFLFKVDGNVYAVPNVHVVETTSIDGATEMPPHIDVQTGSVPLVNLHDVLEVAATPPTTRRPLVVVEYLGRQLAMTCDKIVGPREIVLKSLGGLLSPLPLYAGGTISGSGKVQLILDPAALVRLAYTDAAEDVGHDHRSFATARARTSGPGGGRRVLVADDSLVIRSSVSRVLERAGYLVDVAEDGEAAWARLTKTRYDVLITDIEMPRLDGFGLIEKLRRQDEMRHLPVVVISSRAGLSSRQRASKLGARSFLGKPIKNEDLIAAIAAAR